MFLQLNSAFNEINTSINIEYYLIKRAINHFKRHITKMGDIKMAI
jgi:hypothetical protein